VATGLEDGVKTPFVGKVPAEKGLVVTERIRAEELAAPAKIRNPTTSFFTSIIYIDYSAKALSSHMVIPKVLVKKGFCDGCDFLHSKGLWPRFP